MAINWLSKPLEPKVVPYVEPVDAILQAADKLQNRYDKVVNVILDKQQQAIDLDVSDGSEATREKKTALVADLNNNLDKMAKLDFLNPDNIKRAENLFKPITEDDEIMQAASLTAATNRQDKIYRDLEAKGDDKFAYDNYAFFNEQRQMNRNIKTYDEWKKKATNPSFIEYVDIHKLAVDYASKLGTTIESSVQSDEGSYFITTDNKRITVDEIMAGMPDGAKIRAQAMVNGWAQRDNIKIDNVIEGNYAAFDDKSSSAKAAKTSVDKDIKSLEEKKSAINGSATTEYLKALYAKSGQEPPTKEEEKKKVIQERIDELKTASSDYQRRIDEIEASKIKFQQDYNYDPATKTVTSPLDYNTELALRAQYSLNATYYGVAQAFRKDISKISWQKDDYDFDTFQTQNRIMEEQAKQQAAADAAKLAVGSGDVFQPVPSPEGDANQPEIGIIKYDNQTQALAKTLSSSKTAALDNYNAASAQGEGFTNVTQMIEKADKVSEWMNYDEDKKAGFMPGSQITYNDELYEKEKGTFRVDGNGNKILKPKYQKLLAIRTNLAIQETELSARYALRNQQENLASSVALSRVKNLNPASATETDAQAEERIFTNKNIRYDIDDNIWELSYSRSNRLNDLIIPAKKIQYRENGVDGNKDQNKYISQLIAEREFSAPGVFDKMAEEIYNANREQMDRRKFSLDSFKKFWRASLNNGTNELFVDGLDVSIEEDLGDSPNVLKKFVNWVSGSNYEDADLQFKSDLAKYQREFRVELNKGIKEMSLVEFKPAVTFNAAKNEKDPSRDAKEKAISFINGSLSTKEIGDGWSLSEVQRIELNNKGQWEFVSVLKQGTGEKAKTKEYRVAASENYVNTYGNELSVLSQSDSVIQYFEKAQNLPGKAGMPIFYPPMRIGKSTYKIAKNGGAYYVLIDGESLNNKSTSTAFGNVQAALDFIKVKGNGY